MNILRPLSALALLVLGAATASLQDNDKSAHSISIRLYAREEGEGSRNHKYVPILVDGKPGELIFLKQQSLMAGVTEVDRCTLLQAPQWSKDDGNRVGWPVSNALIVATVTETEWKEDRPNENGIKVPVSFRRIEAVIEPKYGDFEPLIFFATNFDKPETLIKSKRWVILEFEAMERLRSFVQAGTPVSIGLSVPGTGSE